jgi:succinate dehydrogenase / fumarate reductase flavoprotein subunit
VTPASGVYLDFADAIKRLGENGVRERYGNLFDIYHEITAESAYQVPMRIFPAVHYTMGGLWVDYNLMSNVPGLFVLGEANFSDHGANRLGASALMQGLADGYFVIPYTIGDYLAGAEARHRVRAPTARNSRRPRTTSTAMIQRLLSIKGKHARQPLPQAPRQDHVGILRHGPHQGRPGEGAPKLIRRAARGILGERPRARLRRRP